LPVPGSDISLTFATLGECLWAHVLIGQKVTLRRSGRVAGQRRYLAPQSTRFVGVRCGKHAPNQLVSHGLDHKPVENVANNWAKVPDFTFWPTRGHRGLAQYHS